MQKHQSSWLSGRRSSDCNLAGAGIRNKVPGNLLRQICFVALCWAFVGLAGAQVAESADDPTADPEALLFVNTCLRCHPGTLTGNELINTPSRSVENLETAVRRMQQRTGPLTEEQIKDLTALMKDPAFYDRVAEAKLSAEEAAGANTVPGTAGAPIDVAAKLYISKCAGCHSLSGTGKPGGSLARAMGYPQAQLWTAVKRMEMRVGALPDDEVTSLVALLKDRDVQRRLADAGYVEAPPQVPPGAAVPLTPEPPAVQSAEDPPFELPVGRMILGIIVIIGVLVYSSYRLHKKESM